MWQRQTADSLHMCRIEFFENVAVVARRYAVLRTIKGVYQRQDVAVEGKNTPTDETWCVEFLEMQSCFAYTHFATQVSYFCVALKPMME